MIVSELSSETTLHWGENYHIDKSCDVDRVTIGRNCERSEALTDIKAMINVAWRHAAIQPGDSIMPNTRAELL